MRIVWCSILLCACAADHDSGSSVQTLQPPTDCTQGHLSFVTDLPGALNTEASVAMSGYAFGNATIQHAGELVVYPPDSAQGTPQVHLYFTKLVLDDATVPARGVVVMPDQNIEAANCEADALQGAITVGSNGVYSFMVTGLKAGADCSGAPITGSFAGCFARQQ